MKTLTREGIQRMTTGGTTVVGGGGTSGGGGGTSGGGGNAQYALEAEHARTADEATHATSADTATEANHATNSDYAGYATEAGTANEAMHANSAANLDNDSPVWSKVLRKDIADTAAEVITFAKGLISTLKSFFNGGIEVTGGVATDTLNVSGNLQGDTADFTDVTMDNLGTQHDKVTKIWVKDIDTENLSVTKEAHFKKLVVDEMLSNKGAIIISSANCVVEQVTAVNTYFDVYFSNKDRDGNSVANSWVIGDHALCLTFNGEGAGTFSDVRSRYYWRKVIAVSSNVTYLGATYHRIRLSNTTGQYDGTTEPAPGDNLVQLGYSGGVSSNAYRQSAIIISAYPTMDAGLTPPSQAFYQGIDDFALASHRYTYQDGVSNEFIGNFKVIAGGSTHDITTFFATATALGAEVTNRMNAESELRMTADQIKLGVTNGWLNYISNAESVNATPNVYDGTSSTVVDPVFGNVLQMNNTTGVDWQLLHQLLDSYTDLTANYVTWFCVVKPVSKAGGDKVFFGSGYPGSYTAIKLSYEDGAMTIGNGLTSPDYEVSACEIQELQNGWYMCYTSAKLATAITIIQGQTAANYNVGFNSMRGTWQMYYSGIVRGAGYPSLDMIRQGSGLKKAGIDVVAGKVDVLADNFRVTNNQGVLTLGLDADGNFVVTGTIRAKNFYHNVCLVDGPGTYDVDDADLVMVGGNRVNTATQDIYINLPDPTTCEGKVVDIHGGQRIASLTANNVQIRLKVNDSTTFSVKTAWGTTGIDGSNNALRDFHELVLSSNGTNWLIYKWTARDTNNSYIVDILGGLA